MWTNRFLSQKLKTKELQLDALDVILIETNNIFENLTLEVGFCTGQRVNLLSNEGIYYNLTQRSLHIFKRIENERSVFIWFVYVYCSV